MDDVFCWENVPPEDVLEVPAHVSIRRYDSVSDYFIVKPADAGSHWIGSHAYIGSRLIGQSRRQGCLNCSAFCNLLGTALRGARLGSASSRLAARFLL